jgi:hypothetical protein
MTAEALTLHSNSVNPRQPIYESTTSYKRRLPEEPSDLDRMVLVRVERLYEEQTRLIDQRNVLLDNAAISLNPTQQAQLEHIDNRLDIIEAEIEQFSNRAYRIDVEAIENMVTDQERRIQTMAQKIRSKK